MVAVEADMEAVEAVKEAHQRKEVVQATILTTTQAEDPKVTRDIRVATKNIKVAKEDTIREVTLDITAMEAARKEVMTMEVDTMENIIREKREARVHLTAIRVVTAAEVALRDLTIFTRTTSTRRTTSSIPQTTKEVTLDQAVDTARAMVAAREDTLKEVTATQGVTAATMARREVTTREATIAQMVDTAVEEETNLATVEAAREAAKGVAQEENLAAIAARAEAEVEEVEDMEAEVEDMEAEAVVMEAVVMEVVDTEAVVMEAVVMEEEDTEAVDIITIKYFRLLIIVMLTILIPYHFTVNTLPVIYVLQVKCTTSVDIAVICCYFERSSYLTNLYFSLRTI